MGSQATIKQPDYGNVLVPTKLDQLARESPNHVFAAIPKSSNFADGLEDITVSTLANAVNRIAWWLESTIGKSTDFETIAYIGPGDLRYFILAIAATKVGYKTLLPSPRNSIEGQLSLFESTKCSTLFSAAHTKIDNLLSKRQMRSIIVGELWEWISGDPVPHYPYEKLFEVAEHDPFLVLHTSGSTGLPKPVVVKHGWATGSDRHNMIPPLDGYEHQYTRLKAPTRLFFGLPPFHAAGVGFMLIIPLFFGCTVIWPPPGRPVGVEVVENLLDSIKLDVCYMAPSTLEELSQSKPSVEKLTRLKYVGYIGGPVTRQAGNIVSKYAPIINTVGTTESLTFPLFLTDPEDWMYFHYDPKLKGLEFRDVGDGLFEEVIVRHPSTDKYHSTWYTFPDKQEYSVKDLFTKHPTKPNLWLYMGRADDIIVLSNGEKLNPTNMEDTIRNSPDVSEVIIVGQGRFETAALIELKGKLPRSDEEREKLLSSLHPYIVEGNKIAPAHAKLSKDRIAFILPDKPILRSAKGTVRRAASVKLYEEEINQIYAEADGKALSHAVQLNLGDKQSLVQSLREIMMDIAGIEELSPDQDIFSAGIDSLQVMSFGRQLKNSFAVYDTGVLPDQVTPKLTYLNPTISKLADALQKLAIQQGKPFEAMEEERIKKMEDILAKYAKSLPKQDSTKPYLEDKYTVVITGSTGSLGSYLLDSLLTSPRVSKIICLNRGSHGESKQKEGNASRGLVAEWGDKVQFFQTDLSKSDLGLNKTDYETLLNEASFIIHNQWQVDFNLALDSFEPHIAGVRDLIDLSIKSIKRPPILFTSSIATLGNWAEKHSVEDVPEIPIHDFTIPSPMGYGESKYVAELLLEKACEISGLRAAICRIGQIAGPVVKGGVWSKQEWLPTIIASSKYLSKVPAALAGQDAIDWIPVDTLSIILVELLLTDISSSSPATKYHHLVNPKLGSWSTLVPAITDYLSQSSSPKNQTFEVVSFEEWVKALKESSEKEGDIGKNPGVKLLEFFESMSQGGLESRLETKKTVEGSETMRGLSGVGREWMEIWLKQWGF